MSPGASDTREQQDRATRFPIPMALTYRRAGETAWHQGKVENMSRTGVLFTAEGLMQPASPVELAIQLPVDIAGPGAAQVRCVGNVVRTVLQPTSESLPAMAAAIRSYRRIPKVRPRVP